MESERRKIVRRPVRYPAWMDFGDGSDLRNCVLVDASDEGVRVVTPAPIEWPSEIELVLGYGKNGRRRCRVAWCNGRQAGLEFLAKNTPLNLPPRGRRPAVTAQMPVAPSPQAAPHGPLPLQSAAQPVAFDIDTLPPQ
jgi:hypothetical protein